MDYSQYSENAVTKAQEMIVAANFLQMELAQSKITDFLKSKLSKTDFVDFFEFAGK